MLQFNDEQLKITDKTKFNNWLNSPKLKHTNKLDYQDKYVQRIIEKFHNVDAFKIYNFLRIYYWQHCETYNDFENEIKEKIENINNIGELL